MSNTSVHGAADKATDNRAFEYTARVGFAASGVLHLLVAFIILRLAFGSGGNADQSGALGTLAKQPGGTLMLWIAAVGLVALGLWRVAEAVVGSKPGERSGQQKDDSPGMEARKVHRAGHRQLRDRLLCRRSSPWAAASPAASRTPDRLPS